MEPPAPPLSLDEAEDLEPSPRPGPSYRDSNLRDSIISAEDATAIEEIVGGKIISRSSMTVKDSDQSPHLKRMRRRCVSAFSLPSRASAIPTKGGKRYSDSSLYDYKAKKDKSGPSSSVEFDSTLSSDRETFLSPASESSNKGLSKTSTSPLVKIVDPTPTASGGVDIPALMNIPSADLVPSIDSEHLRNIISTIPTFLRHSIGNRYRPGVCGPFTVHIERVSIPTEEVNTSLPSVLGLGKALHLIPLLRSFLDIAFDFRKIGTTKFAVSFLKGNIANEFTDIASRFIDRIRRNELWIIYIPDFRVKKKVVLAGVDDPDLDPILIKENLHPSPNWRGSWISPISVDLLNKRIPDEGAPDGFRTIKGRTFIGIFDNFELPSFAYLLGKKIFLRPFVNRVIQCTHCLRFGHLFKTCRKHQEAPMCFKCASPGHLGGDCSSTTTYCINCVRGKLNDPNHQAVSPKCPMLIHNKHVKRIMAVHCVGPIDAENFIRVSGLDTSDDPDNASIIPPITLEDFWPQLLKAPSVVSYAGAVGRNATRDASSATSTNLGYPTKNSKFLANLHILRRKKAERLKKLADRDTPLRLDLNEITPEGDCSSIYNTQDKNTNKTHLMAKNPITISSDSVVLKDPAKDLTPTKLRDINQSIYNSLISSPNPMSKPFISSFLNQFSALLPSIDPEINPANLSLNKAHIINLKNFFVEGLSLFNKLQL